MLKLIGHNFIKLNIKVLKWEGGVGGRSELQYNGIVRHPRAVKNKKGR